MQVPHCGLVIVRFVAEHVHGTSGRRVSHTALIAPSYGPAHGCQGSIEQLVKKPTLRHEVVGKYQNGLQTGVPSLLKLWITCA
jgi:hypothetical protein